ncbi:flagellin [Treponema socranskii]|uniref:Flagellin n=2 Tax=Treponema socranskii TaxID=53419 RepID=U2LAP9_TRESO|nr:flagellin [Treponema socranskii]ERF59715.1 flagellar filament 30.7 kDa core protein FlaB3 [Treponema socranskii subsp. socranskii VPI DR56BR1116 = ATCC 35536]ERK01543.1 flagellar filament 30.7 kDa core protein FlaB3 [Treponema socranskii subsp. socranskii VPI DR56BR1116 = ATCC 35536]MDR9859015.1 flagellin [Treponema socranskii]
MIINHNMSSLYAERVLGISNANIQGNIEKLASGERINKAGDDASGLAVSEKLRSQIRGLNQAGRNIENGVSFLQTTEGYLQETTDILQRVRELAIQASNGIYSDEDRMQIQVEVSQLVSEVDRVASQAQFNGMNMLTGSFGRWDGAKTMQFHVGANVDQNVRVYIGTMTATALGLKNANGDNEQISIATPDLANATLGAVDSALLRVTKQRADLGAYQNRFEMASKGVNVAAENMQAAESRIRDTDMAAEIVDYTKNSILTQSGTAMLAQANSQTQNVLALLQ